MRVAIFGRGKLGSALAKQLGQAGFEVSLHAGRSAVRRAPHADVLILAVPDAAIAQLALRLAPHLTRAHVVLHCAGARGPAELQACAARGAAVAGFILWYPSPAVATPRLGVSVRRACEVRATRCETSARALNARCVVQRCSDRPRCSALLPTGGPRSRHSCSAAHALHVAARAEPLPPASCKAAQQRPAHRLRPALTDRWLGAIRPVNAHVSAARPHPRPHEATTRCPAIGPAPWPVQLAPDIAD